MGGRTPENMLSCK